MILDAFPFFNELELLHLRLRELAEVVDRFLLVEATHTHAGEPKELVFAANRDHFARYPIEHVVVPLPPAGPGLDPWRDRENVQRNAILQGLGETPDDAVVLISDLDEIPHPEAVRRMGDWLREAPAVLLRQRFFYYFLNGHVGTWHGTVGAHAGTVRARTPQRLRMLRTTPEQALIPPVPGGWHFSYLGGAATVAKKIRAFAHQEFNEARYVDPAAIAARIEAGADLFDRPGLSVRYEPLDASYPTTLLRDPDPWRHLIHPPTADASALREAGPGPLPAPPPVPPPAPATAPGIKTAHPADPPPDALPRERFYRRRPGTQP